MQLAMYLMGEPSAEFRDLTFDTLIGSESNLTYLIESKEFNEHKE